MIDCHLHLWTQDESTRDKRAERADQLRTEAERLGVDKICLIGDSGPTIEACREANRTVAKYVEEHPDLFYGWARVNPHLGAEGVNEFRRAVEEDGLVGLKNITINEGGMKCSDERFYPFAEAAVEMDVPIIVHVLHRLDPYPEIYPCESYTEDALALAQQFPDLKFIAAHIAGGGDWEYRIKNIQHQENLYLDISGSCRDAGIIEMATEYLGADRLVHGTDTWLVPGVGKLLGADITPEEKAIIGYNFEELLGDNVPNAYTDTELEERREQARHRFEQLETPREETIVVANGFLGHDPFRDHDGSAAALLETMDRNGIDKTLVSSVESTMYRNCHQGNKRLADAVDGHEDRLIPLATINPTYPAWREDLDTCLTEFEMKGVKVLPAYHDYDLNNPRVAELLRYCADADVPVVFTTVLEDQRQRHPRVKLRGFAEAERKKWWSDEQVNDLITVLHECPETDVVIADAWEHAPRIQKELCTVQQNGVRLDNHVRSGATLFVLGDLNLYFTALADDLLADIGPDQLVVGPKLPFKYFEASYEYTEQLPVDEEVKDQIRSENIVSLLQ